MGVSWDLAYRVRSLSYLIPSYWGFYSSMTLHSWRWSWYYLVSKINRLFTALAWGPITNPLARWKSMPTLLWWWLKWHLRFRSWSHNLRVFYYLNTHLRVVLDRRGLGLILNRLFINRFLFYILLHNARVLPLCDCLHSLVRWFTCVILFNRTNRPWINNRENSRLFLLQVFD